MEMFLVILAAASSTFLLLVVFWQLCGHHCRSRTRLDRRLVVSECHPHLICTSVGCQHPYYRVLAEYSHKGGGGGGDEVLPVNLPPAERRFNNSELSRKLSLGSLPGRRDSLANSYRRLSNASSASTASSSRRMSDASSSPVPISPLFLTKPVFITKNRSTTKGVQI